MIEHLSNAKAWPFELARKLKGRIEQQIKAGQRRPDQPVIFETGYGPSGLPHIGTFGEVVRTSFVRYAFDRLVEGKIETRLICVSDDMDGMRKVPPHLPKQEMLAKYLQHPVTSIPDPFGTHASYGDHMNGRLQAFLDSFGFDYAFHSAAALYKNGTYDPMLLRAAQKYSEIMDVMLPTLGEERRATYSPFLPISPKTGRVLYVPMKAVNGESGTITFDDEDGAETVLPVTGGAVKLQWKPDFGMRWAALDVDFEMFGKDHQANAPIYSKICRILGKRPPEQYVYEMFLDEKGEKISKSKGNGIAVEQWLKYAPQESLSLFQFQKPRVAKKLYFDIIPKAVDEYLAYLAKYPSEAPDKQTENPVWHIHAGNVPDESSPISFGLLLNLVSAANTDDPAILWGFIRKYAPGIDAITHPLLDRLVGYALAYFQDFVAPAKTFRAPNQKERDALQDLAQALQNWNDQTTSEALQTLAFDIGKKHAFANLRDWFSAFYEIVLGQTQGPRFGSFAALYGPKETSMLIQNSLDRAVE